MSKLKSENTAAGEQTLVPGVKPITQTDRLRERGVKPMRGNKPQTNAGPLFEPERQIDLADLLGS